MFTDGPATPMRLEVLLDVVKEFKQGTSKANLLGMLQPIPLSDGNQTISRTTLSAALQLSLVEEKSGKIKLSKSFKNKKTTQQNLLEAIDKYVLSSLEIEYHLALFYSYYLGLNKKVYDRVDDKRATWAINFNKDVKNNVLGDNPFNATKHVGLDRWLYYIGLGWFEGDFFHAEPYERLNRNLSLIFKQSKKLSGDDFMIKVAEICPELDGGEIFKMANEYRNYKPEDKQCTLGFSQALLSLHETGLIRLDCPIDSRGWSMVLANPSKDDTIKSDRITIVEYLGGQ